MFKLAQLSIYVHAHPLNEVMDNGSDIARNR